MEFVVMKQESLEMIKLLILDIDGVTGGFNFQSAWTTGYLAGKNSVI